MSNGSSRPFGKSAEIQNDHEGNHPCRRHGLPSDAAYKINEQASSGRRRNTDDDSGDPAIDGCWYRRSYDCDWTRAPRGDENCHEQCQLPCRTQYAVQPKPAGIADALGRAKDFVGPDRCAVLLGDDLFAESLKPFVENFLKQENGARVLLKEVPDPERFGVASLDGSGLVTEIQEKPARPKSNQVVVGLYFYDSYVWTAIAQQVPSARQELEITDVNNAYVKKGLLRYDVLHDAWFDAELSIFGRSRPLLQDSFMSSISVIVPVYKSEESLPENFIERLTATLTQLVPNYEILLIEDCGRDRSWDIIKDLCKKDPRVRGIHFSRNFGQHYGITAGLDHCKMDWAIVMDCDLQDRPRGH